MSEAGTPLIVALDYDELAAALPLVEQLDPARCRLKVGKQLFTREGPAAVTALVDSGFDVFLDLKFHDIPNTVAKAVLAAADLGVWMVNVHASGGGRMMNAAMQALSGIPNRPLLTAVTEAERLRDAMPDNFALVTPGIRLPGDDAGDQRRVVTPVAAMGAGANYLVMGRSITGASDPAAAVDRVLSSLAAD